MVYHLHSNCTPLLEKRLYQCRLNMKIALLEDDESTAATTAEWLRQAGYDVDTFSNGADCARAVEKTRYDLCLLDWMTPDLEGIDVLSRLHIRFKEKTPPVIFITGRDSDEDLARALSAGADDYVIKPISQQVLLARIHALLRRTGLLAHVSTQQSYGPITIDYARREVFLNDHRADLTERETDLAIHLFQNMGSLLTREHLIQVVWRMSTAVDTRTVDVHISALRRKLLLNAESGWKLISIYRHGYRLERQEPNS